MLNLICQPEVTCPFPSALNPYTETIQRYINQWVNFHGFFDTDAEFQHFQAGKLGWIAGRAYPTARFEDVLLAATFMTWLYMVDGVVERQKLSDDPELLRSYYNDLLKFMKKPRRVDDDESPVMTGLCNLWERISDSATPTWIERFLDSFQAYIDGIVWEALNRVIDRIPSREEYITIRRQASGMELFFDLIEVTNHLTLSEYILDHEHIHDLKMLANDAVSWLNDISYVKKTMRLDDVQNLIVVLQNEYRLSAQDAMKRAVQDFNFRVIEYIAVEQLLPMFAGKIERDVRRYTEGLRNWIRGTIDWSHETGLLTLPVSEAVSQYAVVC